MKSIAAFTLTFFVYIILVSASVLYIIKRQEHQVTCSKSTYSIEKNKVKTTYLFYPSGLSKLNELKLETVADSESTNSTDLIWKAVSGFDLFLK